jgi:D-alanyl-D-alanine carboxypeptidase (penicillin-binding protein 5/6)
MKQSTGLLIVVVALLLCNASTVAGNRTGVLYKAALVVDAESGEVLFAERSKRKVIPASLVKMMTSLIALEKIERGEEFLTDTYTVTAAASRIGGHQVYLKHGEIFSLGELLKAVVIGSANDAAYAIAEHVAGSHSAFVAIMNRRASELGMRNTRFANSHGLPPERRKGQTENETTARDMALLARAVVRQPRFLKWSSTRLDSFRDGTFQLLNTNHKFLRQVEGADGLKTGYHSRGAGFSLVGSAVRGGRRLIVVVMGAERAAQRLKVASRLIDKGFAGEL